MDNELIVAISELGSTALLIFWLMRTDIKKTERLRNTQDKFMEHLEDDIKKERGEKGNE